MRRSTRDCPIEPLLKYDAMRNYCIMIFRWLLSYLTCGPHSSHSLSASNPAASMSSCVTLICFFNISTFLFKNASELSKSSTSSSFFAVRENGPLPNRPAAFLTHEGNGPPTWIGEGKMRGAASRYSMLCDVPYSCFDHEADVLRLAQTMLGNRNPSHHSTSRMGSHATRNRSLLPRSSYMRTQNRLESVTTTDRRLERVASSQSRCTT